jgi:hypothetical protein
MSALYEIGDAVALSWDVEIDGTPTNATVTLTVTLPDGTTSTPTVSNPAPGESAAEVTATQSGLHTYRWVATGAVTAADSGTFRVGSGYCTLSQLKASLSIAETDETDDEALTDAILQASRYIDRRCNTTFYPVTETRTFPAQDGYTVWVDDFTSAEGIEVFTGTDGTWTTEVTASDVLPFPRGIVGRGGAYYQLKVPTGVLPTSAYYDTVQVTATWGWHYVPEDVQKACLLKAAHLHKRKDSPHGIEGQNDYGTVRISRYEDPDVEMLLRPFIPIAIA